jgi:cytoskeletal protein CcmA (bactofilin family)
MPARSFPPDPARAGGPAELRGGGGPLPVTPLPHVPTVLGAKLLVAGEVRAEQDLVLMGRVEGSIGVPNHALTIHDGALLRGPAFARIVTVSGTVVGDITASELVEILPGASVTGDVTAPRIYLDEEATLVGRIDMRRADAAVRVARYRLDRQGDAAPR